MNKNADFCPPGGEEAADGNSNSNSDGAPMIPENPFQRACIQARQKYEQTASEQQRLSNLISNVRIVFFLAAIAITAALFYWSEARWGWMAAIALLLVFLAILKKHDRVQRQIDYCRGMVQVYSRYLDRINGSWIAFPDCGPEFVSLEHSYTGDLDIFGPRSLYQWLSVAHTHTGRQRLRELLDGPERRLEAIEQRQEAVRELSGRTDFALNLECKAMINPAVAKSPEHLLAMAEEARPLFRRPGSQFLAVILPVMTLTSSAVYLAGIGGVSGYIPLTLLAVQVIIAWLGARFTEPALGYAYLLQENTSVYKELFELIEGSSFQAELLVKFRLLLFNRGRSASEVMKLLESISEAINWRYQPIIYFILNACLLWDLHCAFWLERWKVRYGRDIRAWMESLAMFEALSSLAVAARINGMAHSLRDSGGEQSLADEWCWPELLPDYGVLRAEALGHPLIGARQCVRNDLNLQHNARIVTGSNMSGKSTLLRAIGINLVLAYAGSAVCARRLSCSIMDVITSMVIRDDLASGISTFYAELLRIAMITEQARQGHPVFYLIDEIFRGTNSLDRIAGAQAVLRNLQANGAIGLISTHDFELCDFEKELPSQFHNCHFEEQYQEGRISFDYKLREGRCVSSNARHLMRLVGIECFPLSTGDSADYGLDL